MLWKHRGTSSHGRTECERRSRRLVISFITTIGNYDYGFYWMLLPRRHDRARDQGHGIVVDGAPSSLGRAAGPRATLIAEGLYAMNHQHFFNDAARLRISTVEANAVYELHTVGLAARGRQSDRLGVRR